MLTVDRRIAAPPAAVWELLIDLDAWPRWGPTIRSATLDEPYRELAQGVTGTVRTPLPVDVPFVITEFDPGRHWAWTVAGIPATSHRVEPLGDGSRASIAVPLWAPAYLTVCAIALRRIDDLATR
jgi:uncharacterized protein YndB with AHSA1/START domain